MKVVKINLNDEVLAIVEKLASFKKSSVPDMVAFALEFGLTGVLEEFEYADIDENCEYVIDPRFKGHITGEGSAV